MVPNVLGNKASLLSDLGKDLNNIYSGYANVTGGFFPFLLKGSTYTDTIYGALGNRSGMIIVGAALLGGTGLHIRHLRENFHCYSRLLLPQRDQRCPKLGGDGTDDNQDFK